MCKSWFCIILKTGTCYEFPVSASANSHKTPLFNFNGNLQYFQKKDRETGFKNGVGIIGHSLTSGKKDNSFVIGSPNFNLGNPLNTVKKDKECTTGCTYKDDRFGGFGNILRYGKLPASGHPLRRVFLNPSKNPTKNAFRVKLKKELQDKEQGTPALYLGWTVITGKIFIV